MPRKTRREKFAKKLHKLTISTKLPVLKNKLKNKPTETLVEKTSAVKKQPVPIVKDPFEDKVPDFFLYDLKKSLTIIIAVLILETALYFTAQTGLLKFMN